MKVTIRKVRRLDRSTAWSEGHNEKGHEVAFVLPWSRMRGIAEDVAAGEEVTVTVPHRAIVHVKNPRMRRAA